MPNFAQIIQLCPTLQYRAEVLKLSILFTLQIQDFLTENWVTFYCELSVKLKCIACLIALILTKNSLHRIQPRNSSDSKRKNDTCPEGLDLIRISSFSNLKCQETSLAERNFWPNALLCKKNSKKLDCCVPSEILYPSQNWFTTSMWILILASATVIVFTTIVNSLPTDDENCQCGKSLRTRNLARIWGGKTTSIRKYPWHIAILEYQQGYEPPDFTLEYHCGGSLITPKRVVTAYHCIYGKIEP